MHNVLRSLLIALLAISLPLVANAQVKATDIALIEDVDGSITAAAATPNSYLAKASCAARAAGYTDTYDAIFVYSAIPLNFLTNTQQGWPVRQATRGIGRTPTNSSAAFCSNSGRLRQAVKMGAVATMPDDPDDTYRGIPGYALSGVELIAHEFGHQWLASITFDKGDGTGKHCYLRGVEGGGGDVQPGDEMCDGYPITKYNNHWSHYFNSGSVMYGSMIEDLGNGKFKFYYKDPKYSQLDQYLMGIRKASEVEPMFLVLAEGSNVSSATIPQVGPKEYTGVRVDFTIEDVIRAEGERSPSYDQCHWKGLTILLYDRQNPYNSVMVEKLVRYANRWEEFYSWATDGRGSFDMTADGRGAGTEGCPGTPRPPDPEDTGTVIPDQGPNADGVDVPEVSEEVIQPDSIQPPDWSNIDLGSDDQLGSDYQPDSSTAPDRPVDSTQPLDLDEMSTTPCFSGAVQCYKGLVLKCRSDGSGWAIEEDCGDKGCENGRCLGGSSGGCSAGARSGALPLVTLAAFLLTGVFISRRLRHYETD